MLKRLIPREEAFFDMFDSICENIVAGSLLFQKMVDDRPRMKEHARELKRVEHATDEMVHDSLSKLHKTFITPLDREDIHILIMRLDDILDLTDIAASSLILYKPKKIPAELSKLAAVMVESAKVIREMVGLLRDLRKNAQRILEYTVEINRLENEADDIRRLIMARLFEKEKNAIELIKWKDIINFAENSTDKCEDVSDILESIVIENS